MKLEIDILPRIVKAVLTKSGYTIADGDEKRFIEKYIKQWLKSITISREELVATNEAIEGIADEIHELGEENG